MNAATIVGYTFRAENYTPAGVIEALTFQFDDWVFDASDPETALDDLATFLRIDRSDENSFHTDEFPKVIFASQVGEGDLFLDDDGSYREIDEL